jgi:hypothetical protein
MAVVPDHRGIAAGASFAVIALALVWPGDALGQPCCSGSTTIGTARLARYETALIGIAARFDTKTGDFGSGAAYFSVEDQSQRAIEEEILIAVRVYRALQVGATLSFHQTWKESRGESDFGGGLGDLALSIRYDFLEPGEHAFVPGIALSCGVSIPTGRATESSVQRLAADATTSGYTQGTIALSVADTFFEERLNLETVAAFTHWFARGIDDLSIARGPQFTLSAGASWVFGRDLTLGTLGTLDVQGETRVDGEASPGSSRRATTLAVVIAYRIESIRLQASVFDTLPIDQLGKNEIALFGVRLAVIGAVL